MVRMRFLPFILAEFILVQSETIIPREYHYLAQAAAAVNGSHIRGNCSTLSTGGAVSTCYRPQGSVLFDGRIPIIFSDSNTWAQDLLVLRKTSSSATIQLAFDLNVPNYRGIDHVELILLNDQDFGAAVEGVSVTLANNVFGFGNPNFNITPIPASSCFYLEKICMPVVSARRALRLEFTLHSNSTFLYLAEVRFHYRSTCDIQTPLFQHTVLSLAFRQSLAPQYFYSIAQISRVNGSTIHGSCRRISDLGRVLVCMEPATSVLFDRRIPSIFELGGNMWARELLVIQSTTEIPTAQLVFDFSTVNNYNGLMEIELVVFNNPEWGIEFPDMRIRVSNRVSGFGDPDAVIVPNVATSTCRKLVRACISISTDKRAVRLEFSDTVYIAEVRFHGHKNCTEAYEYLVAESDEQEAGLTTTTTAVVSSFLTALITLLITSAVFLGLMVAGVAVIRPPRDRRQAVTSNQVASDSATSNRIASVSASDQIAPVSATSNRIASASSNQVVLVSGSPKKVVSVTADMI